MFGAATLTTRVRKPTGLPRGKAAPTYDCGALGRLTMAQMCKRSGLSKNGLQARLARGWTGERLLSKPYPLTCSRARPALAVAAKLAAKYPGRVPTEQEMMALHPMTRQAAWSWRTAWRAALAA